MSNLIHSIFLILVGLMIGSNFQNCSPHSFLSNNSKKSHELPVDHPPTAGFETSNLAEIFLIDRQGVESFFSNLLLDENSSIETVNLFNKILSEEIITQQHMFGRSCDPFVTGNMNACGNNLSNLNIALTQPPSTIRFASKIHLCRRLLSNYNLLTPLLEKNHLVNISPNPVNISLAISLYFPAMEFNQNDYNALNRLILEMNNSGIDGYHQWMIIMTTLCESPYWEVL